MPQQMRKMRGAATLGKRPTTLPAITISGQINFKKWSNFIDDNFIDDNRFSVLKTRVENNFGMNFKLIFCIL